MLMYVYILVLHAIISSPKVALNDRVAYGVNRVTIVGKQLDIELA